MVIVNHLLLSGTVQTGLWSEQTQPTNGSAFGLCDRAFQLSTHRQDVSSKYYSFKRILIDNFPRISKVTSSFVSSISHVCSRNLGGKLGASISETLGITNMGELTRFSQAQLGQHFGEKTG